VPPFVLTVLKIVFLALLYFFVFRAIRSIVLDLRWARPRAEPGRPPAPSATGRVARGKTPKSIVVMDERGSKVGTHRLDSNVQIGRADACQIQLSDTYVSQFHARIFRRDGAWFVEDLGSTNGTYLNQRRITTPSELHAGDRLKVGKVLLELKR
jgi:FHA domain